MRRATVAFLLMVGFLLLGASQLHAQSSRSLRGIKIPNPLGIGLTFYNQNQPYRIESLEVEFPGLDPSMLQGFDVENETISNHLRIDYWLLPFLNVFGLVGQIETKTTVDLQGLDIGLPVEINNLVVDSEGTVYGLGLVLAVGGEHWFSTVDYNYTETDLDVATSSVNASVVTPKVGLRLKGGAVWVGAMYQRAEEEHQGVFELPYVGEIPFHVRLREKESWNYLVGATAGLSEHWVLILQGGFSKRRSALATIEYRF